jgi:hypothetical protein
MSRQNKSISKVNLMEKRLQAQDKQNRKILKIKRTTNQMPALILNGESSMIELQLILHTL